VGEKSRGWLKWCSIGCGVLVLIPILVLLVISVRTCVPLGIANRTRAQLDEQFGPPESFTPTDDGSIPAERIRAFLEVRGKLAAPCKQFEIMQAKMRRVDGLDEKAPSGKEMVGATKGLASVGADIAPFIGEFFEQRNKALLEAEMGLGEYTYIFALSYRDRLEAPGDELFFEGGLSPDVLAVLRAALSAQLTASTGIADAERRLLEQEIRASQDDPQRLPWAEQLPPAIEESLLSFRGRLDRAYCSATAGIDMDPDSRRAMIIALY
jgi:hypothetical protein